MINDINRVMMSDSYKYSHFSQYPSNTVNMYDYAEARSKTYFENTVFFGLQYILKKYFTKPITIEEINEAKEYCTFHSIPFNYEGWMKIVDVYKGLIPVTIKAVPEGSVIPNQNVLFTIELTQNDKDISWIVSWMENTIMKVWYTCNIATRSFYIKKMLLEYAQQTSDEPFVDYQLHNFGDRGSSSVESAAFGGMAHLSSFMGTDNFEAVKFVADYYNVEDKFTIAHSIPASEHSTVTSWGKENEFVMVDKYLETYKSSPIIACVADSFDYFNFVDEITKNKFKEKIESEDYPVFVIRPDSGDPKEVLIKTLKIMESNKIDFIINNKGYKVFKKYRIIWGDGITEPAMKIMLDVLKEKKYSSENLAFGMGGALMQGNDRSSNNRDTLGFAIKCSNISIQNEDNIIEDREIYKDPITDKKKKSKKGKIITYYNKETKKYFTDFINKYKDDNSINESLETIFQNGKFIKEYTFDEVRKNINKSF